MTTTKAKLGWLSLYLATFAFTAWWIAKVGGCL